MAPYEQSLFAVKPLIRISIYEKCSLKVLPTGLKIGPQLGPDLGPIEGHSAWFACQIYWYYQGTSELLYKFKGIATDRAVRRVESAQPPGPSPESADASIHFFSVAPYPASSPPFSTGASSAAASLSSSSFALIFA